MPPLKALLISDGRPGHFRLAEGIIAALGRRRPVETQRLEVRRRRIFPTRTLAWLLKGGIPADRILAAGYGIGARAVPRTDVIVSAGGDTLAANVAAAKLLGVPNVFYGSLRRYDPADFALSLSSYDRPPQVMALKPSAFDPDALPSDPGASGLIVGGDTPDIHYGLHDWEQITAFLEASFAHSGKRWIVSNSRRTPPEASRLLAQMADKHDSPIAHFIDVRKPGASSLYELFAGVSNVLCTADSSSMLSESVWARRPVIAIRPSICRLAEAEAGYRRYLERNNWARELAIADLTTERIASLMAEIKPLAANPLDQLASTLERELPALFAQA